MGVVNPGLGFLGRLVPPSQPLLRYSIIGVHWLPTNLELEPIDVQEDSCMSLQIRMR